MRALLLLALLGAGCQEDDGGQRTPPGEDFSQAHTVRFLSPTNGDTVGPTFTARFEAGEKVKQLQFEVDGAPATVSDLSRDTGTVVFTVDAGVRRKLTILGLDGQGAVLSENTVQVTVEAAEGGGTWAAITSPSDGELVYNPVTFTVSRSQDLDRVEILADGWPLGDVDAAGRLSYTFTGTGFARQIEAVGYIDGEAVTRDSISVTVDPGTEPVPSEFTELMMDILVEYPTDGSYAYWWPSGSTWLGNPHDIYYQGKLIAPGDPQHRSFCVGLTWELFMRAFDQADRMTGGDGSLNGMTEDDLDDFRVLWFIVNINGDENVDALEDYGLGERVTDLEDAQPGDVVQFWRNSGSGHNNIFIEWERSGSGDIIGLTYWSTQGSTDGIGYNTEYFGASGSTINPSYVFIARPYMPDQWLPWN